MESNENTGMEKETLYEFIKGYVEATRKYNPKEFVAGEYTDALSLFVEAEMAERFINTPITDIEMIHEDFDPCYKDVPGLLKFRYKVPFTLNYWDKETNIAYPINVTVLVDSGTVRIAAVIAGRCCGSFKDAKRAVQDVELKVGFEFLEKDGILFRSCGSLRSRK